MDKKAGTHELEAKRRNTADGGVYQLGVYKPGLKYRKESMAFFRDCVGEETYTRAMSSEAGRRHHYVAARAFLDQTDWEKFVWIEEFGSLTGFPGFSDILTIEKNL